VNTLIQEFAEQATTYIEPTSNSGEGWIFDKEKFAQLIVRECDRLNRRQSFELSGVVADSEHKDGPGFDSTCLDTVKRVEQYLHDSAFVRHFGFEPNTTKEPTP
jgi:hypothetical protein